jgi:hypothetical protein
MAPTSGNGRRRGRFRTWALPVDVVVVVDVDGDGDGDVEVVATVDRRRCCADVIMTCWKRVSGYAGRA